MVLSWEVIKKQDRDMAVVPETKAELVWDHQLVRCLRWYRRQGRRRDKQVIPWERGHQSLVGFGSRNGDERGTGHKEYSRSSIDFLESGSF